MRITPGDFWLTLQTQNSFKYWNYPGLILFQGLDPRPEVNILNVKSSNTSKKTKTRIFKNKKSFDVIRNHLILNENNEYMIELSNTLKEMHKQSGRNVLDNPKFRSPSSMVNRLLNFLDCEQRPTRAKGLSGGGEHAKKIFNEFIKNQFGSKEKKFKKIEEMQEQGKLTISALAFIRGRSLSNVIFIIDEAQNLTPHEVKTIITRAGENTKIIFTGDVFQIDTPYLDEQSNGLSYLIDRLKGDDLFAHITLEKGERSELANLANDLL